MDNVCYMGQQRINGQCIVGIKKLIGIEKKHNMKYLANPGIEEFERGT